MLGGQRYFVKKPISLVGFMGSGKTSVGKLLSLNIGIDFVDTDQLIVQITKKTVSEIINAYGEDEFRSAETEALKMAITKKRIIATGGGCVESVVNRELLKKTCVVWLKVDAKTSAKRIKNYASRPMFKDVNNAESILESRNPMYGELSDININTNNKSVDDCTEEIINKLLKSGVISL